MHPHSLEVTVPLSAIKGRGSATALTHRFAKDERAAFDDGWGTIGNAAIATNAANTGNASKASLALGSVDAAGHMDDDPFASSGSQPTEVIFEDAKSVITRNDSPDLPFAQGLNPYRGCEHGCIYCFARPTHSYLGLSPGLDFERKIIAKRNVAQVLRQELAAKHYKPQLLSLGAATDCYQPVERELRLTRQVLEVLQEARLPFAIITKSSAIERDLDIIAPLAAQGLAAVYVTITSLDGALIRKLEPRAASPQRRLRSIETMVRMGIPVGVSVAPQIPFVNVDMEQVLHAAWQAGARSAFYSVLRLPWELAPLFQQWLELHLPDRAARVMARVQDTHGIAHNQRDAGKVRQHKVYNADFSTRMKGQGLWADLLRQRFATTCAKLGYNRERLMLDLSQFRPPSLHGQGLLF